LTDVNVSAAVNDNILTVSGDVFYPFDPSTLDGISVHKLESTVHTNVVSAGLVDGDTLQYDGTNWVRVSVASLFPKRFTIKEIPTSTYTPIIGDFDNTILMVTQTSTTVTLPTISNMGSEYGHVLRICKNMSVPTASSLIIIAPTGYAIETGTVTTSSTFTSGNNPTYQYQRYLTGQIMDTYSNEPFANITIQLNNGTKWSVMGGHGTWDRKVRTVLNRRIGTDPYVLFSDTTTFESL
jgi:hypothetical protein